MSKISSSLTQAIGCALLLQQEVASFKQKSFVHNIKLNGDGTWTFDFYYEDQNDTVFKGKTLRVSDCRGFICVEALEAFDKLKWDPLFSEKYRICFKSNLILIKRLSTLLLESMSGQERMISLHKEKDDFVLKIIAKECTPLVVDTNNYFN